MQPIRLAGALAAFAITTTLVGSAVVAQQSGLPRAESQAQAIPAWSAAIDGLRGLADYFSGSGADDPLQALPSFEAYADDDEPGSRRGGQREDGGRRGGEHEHGGRRGGEREDGGRRGGEREDGGRRGGYRGDDEGRERRGGHRDDDRDGPRGYGRGGDPHGGMMARRGLGGLCGPYGNHMVSMMLMRLERTANPTESQRAAFDKLKEAAAMAGETARAGCPTERAFTPMGRLAAAEKRMEAMLAAIRLVRPPLEEFFALLSEEQKARVYASSPRSAPPEGRRDWRERPRQGDGPRRDGRRDGWPDPWRGRL